MRRGHGPAAVRGQDDVIHQVQERERVQHARRDLLRYTAQYQGEEKQ